ncbi:uncharacterized protein MONOS_1497 [Monocercomonoides exilis]|uniref:uncharacterized protein n=1 Tax=Monocercomonoides exilis TaxID=2049356 RepID=UPI0035593DEC|nr:hypothetical protein MONOS_1497 [Monocercomonoides exilis]|eukprot:MONOS_1497.1-p1 / transcript=MONOS_1497.1 / gene=MONOS_1497 / organism=Monocercomonoides_exilis_PA203 / gene_product=unspecified product / transcript_product=unspecified product / location=Mono_scaffold00026:178272-179064(+) / protein_length=178 / sequence_SO=supercontig / SO=protein_coding / is_pseudo=false
MAELKTEKRYEQAILDRYICMTFLGKIDECRHYGGLKANGEKNILKHYHFEDKFYLANEHIGLKLLKAKTIKSPFAVNIVEAINVDDNELFIIFEFCKGIVLKEDVLTRKKQLRYYSDEELWNITTELLLGLFEYFKVGLKHGNIHLKNILMPFYGHVKLGELRIKKPSSMLGRTPIS